MPGPRPMASSDCPVALEDPARVGLDILLAYSASRVLPRFWRHMYFAVLHDGLNLPHAIAANRQLFSQFRLVLGRFNTVLRGQ